MRSPPTVDPSTGRRARVIRKNLLVVGIAYAAGGAGGFIAQVVLARNVAPADFGLYVAAASLVAIVRVVHQLGGAEYLVREGAREPSRLGVLVGDVIVLTGFTTLLAIGVATAAGITLGFRGSGVAAAALLALMSGAAAVSGALRSAMQAIERMELSSAVSIGVAVASVAGMIAAVAAGWGIVGVAAAGAFAALAGIPAAWMILRPHVAVRLRPSLGAARLVARASLPFAAVGMFLFGANYADTLVIRGFLGDDQTAIYGAAYRVFMVLGWLPLIFANSVYRTLSDLAYRDRPRFGQFVERSAAALLVLAVPLAVGGTLVGGKLVPMVFGDAYADGAGVLRVLLWGLPFAFPGVLLIAAVVLGDRPQTAGRILAVGFAANLVANLAVVPVFGIRAAAWTTLGTEAFLAVAAGAALRSHGVGARWAGYALPAAASAALMALVVWPLREAPLPLAVTAGGAAYGMGLLVLRTPERLLRARPPRAIQVTTPPSISVVIPTYGRAHLLAGCLDGVDNQTLPPDEILCVYRESDAETGALLDRWVGADPEHRRRVPVERPGIVPALEEGTRAARSAVIAFLDDDAIPLPGWLEHLAPAFADPSVGAAGGRLLDHVDGVRRTGRARRVGVVTWYGRVVGKHHCEGAREGSVDWLTGSNMAIRAELVRHDETLAHTGAGLALCNDLDTCLFVRRAGYLVWYTPHAIVEHHATSFRDSALGTRVEGRGVTASAANRTYVLAKHFRGPRRIAMLVYGIAVGSASVPGPGRAIAELAHSPRRAMHMARRIPPAWRGRRAGMREFRRGKYGPPTQSRPRTGEAT